MKLLNSFTDSISSSPATFEYKTLIYSGISILEYIDFNVFHVMVSRFWSRITFIGYHEFENQGLGLVRITVESEMTNHALIFVRNLTTITCMLSPFSVEFFFSYWIVYSLSKWSNSETRKHLGNYQGSFK